MISKLHYITQETTTLTHAMAASAACKAGIDWVQLRIKDKSYVECKEQALLTKIVCRHYGSTFIINDNVALAAEINADGVHLGKQDMSPAEARKVLGPDKIIGGTANTFEDIQKLVKQGVNYIGLGPYRFTTTKQNLSPIIGIDGYEAILRQCRKAGITTPIIAIGGITTADTQELLQTGIHGIAVSSCITKAENKIQTIAQFKEYIKTKNIAIA